MQYREWAWYFHKLKASENAAHKCNNRDMHANECNYYRIAGNFHDFKNHVFKFSRFLFLRLVVSRENRENLDLAKISRYTVSITTTEIPGFEYFQKSTQTIGR